MRTLIDERESVRFNNGFCIVVHVLYIEFQEEVNFTEYIIEYIIYQF